MEDEKKLAAIMAAVGMYIQSEEEAALTPAESPVEPPKPPVNPWGVGGRQSAMQLRNLMQLKAFHGTRLR